MQTLISTDVDQAAEFLRKGAIIGMPTETVYGLAGNAFDPAAVASIFTVKQRPAFNPLIVHLAGMDRVNDVAREIPAVAEALMRQFWPGPLTLLLPVRSNVPETITAGKPTVAVRVPAHPMALALLEKTEFPLVAPSANPFGAISPTRAAHVVQFFQGRIPFVLDGGACRRGIESTIVGFPDGEPALYRLGAIPLEALEALTGPLRLFASAGTSPDAPGMLLRHYAPETPLILTDDPAATVRDHDGQRIGLLRYREALASGLVHREIVLSPKGSLQEAAAALYDSLHQLDNFNLDVIIAERFPDRDLGRTLNDRLRRAGKAR